MAANLNHIAYRAMTVCNPLELATVEAFVATADLAPGSSAVDIGCGNGVVAAMLADRFGLRVQAVERDPVIAALARERTADVPGVTVVEGLSEEVLGNARFFDLIVALGATQAAGGGLREPAEIFRRLADRLSPSGLILWGDLTWTGEPPDPIRQVIEATNAYHSDAGWRAAAKEAGLRVLRAGLSGDEAWSRYRRALIAAAEDWIAAHPDHPDTAAVRLRADRTEMMFDLARPYLDFGLYLFGRG